MSKSLRAQMRVIETNPDPEFKMRKAIQMMATCAKYHHLANEVRRDMTVFLHDECGWTFQQIADEFGHATRQNWHVDYGNRKGGKSAYQG